MWYVDTFNVDFSDPKFFTIKMIANFVFTERFLFVVCMSIQYTKSVIIQIIEKYLPPATILSYSDFFRTLYAPHLGKSQPAVFQYEWLHKHVGGRLQVSVISLFLLCRISSFLLFFSSMLGHLSVCSTYRPCTFHFSFRNIVLVVIRGSMIFLHSKRDLMVLTESPT